MDFIKALLNIMGGGQIEEAEKKQQQNQQSVQAGSKTPSFANVEDKPEPSRKNKGFNNMVSSDALREWGWEPQESGGITSWQPSKNQASEEEAALPNAANKIESGQNQAEESEEAPITGWNGTQLYTPEQIAKPKVSTEGSSKEVREINPYYDESELSQSDKSDQEYFPLPSLGYNELSQEDLDIFNLENPFNLKGGLFNETYINNPNQHNEFVATTTDPYLLASLPYMDYSNWGGVQGSNSLKAAEARESWANRSPRATQEQKEKYPAEAQKARDEAEKSKEALQAWADSMQQDAINITEHNSIPFDPEAALEEYLNNGVASNPSVPGTDSTGTPDDQGGGDSGAGAKQGTAETDQASDAIVEQAAAENDYRPIGMETAIQGDLANAFRASLSGNEEARNYYTDVSSKIYEYYQEAFLMANGYDAPYNNLFDFCMHCTPDEFWEYAQFTHSYFGMYTGPEFDNPDGTLNEQAIYDFYNNCKSIYTISRVLGMDEDVIGAFISDYKTAQDLATYLISSGYANPDENFVQGLWAANVVGDATSQDPFRRKDQGRDTWQDAYDQLENSGVQIGGYEEGGRFSAQGRLLENPYNDWTDENRYAIPYNILNDGDALDYLDDWQKIADSIAYSQGWGFDRGR